MYECLHLSTDSFIDSIFLGRRHEASAQGSDELICHFIRSHIDPYRNGYLETNPTMKLSAVVFKRFSMRSFKTIKWLPFRKSNCLVG